MVGEVVPASSVSGANDCIAACTLHRPPRPGGQGREERGACAVGGRTANAHQTSCRGVVSGCPAASTPTTSRWVNLIADLTSKDEGSPAGPVGARGRSPMAGPAPPATHPSQPRHVVINRSAQQHPGEYGWDRARPQRLRV